MVQLKKKPSYYKSNHVLNSPRRSDKGSDTGSDRGSVHSKSSIGKQKKPNTVKTNIAMNHSASVYDSDTESSKLKRVQGSPSRPLNSSKSKQIVARNKYSNISNLYNKDRER